MNFLKEDQRPLLIAAWAEYGNVPVICYIIQPVNDAGHHQLPLQIKYMQLNEHTAGIEALFKVSAAAHESMTNEVASALNLRK